jgi:S-adenosylmethionine/arginine decarboxylase-like enzyme
MQTRHVGSVDYAWDFYGCNGAVLNLPDAALERQLVADVKNAGFDFIGHVFKRFGAGGAISFLALISESHIAIHGAPENGKLLEITIHTCIVHGTNDGPPPEVKKDKLILAWRKAFQPSLVDPFPDRLRGSKPDPEGQEES